MKELLLSADALIVPSCAGGPTAVHTFDMRNVHRAEARLAELSGVNKTKAGELQSTMIQAFGEARRYYATLKAEFGRCKQRLRRIRGEIVLDRAPDLLKAKGLASARSPAGSEDLRDGVVNSDPAYQAATEILLQVEAAMDGMEATAETLKMAYYAIRDLTQGSDPSRRDISGGVGDDEPGALTESERLQNFVSKHSAIKPQDYEGTGFGPPKY